MYDQSKRRNVKTVGCFEGVWFLHFRFTFCFGMNCCSKQPGACVAWSMFFTFKFTCGYRFIEDCLLNSQNRSEVTVLDLTSPKFSTPASQEFCNDFLSLALQKHTHTQNKTVITVFSRLTPWLANWRSCDPELEPSRCGVNRAVLSSWQTVVLESGGEVLLWTAGCFTHVIHFRPCIKSFDLWVYLEKKKITIPFCWVSATGVWRALSLVGHT